MEKKVVFNLRQWSYKQYNQFVAAYSQNREQEAFELALKVIVSWDYPVPLDHEDPIGELEMGQAYEILRALMEAMKQYFDKTIASEVVKVHFKWKMSRYFKFQEARQANEFDTIERMMREICEIQGAEPDKPLNAVQGALAMIAINEAYAKVVQGKG